MEALDKTIIQTEESSEYLPRYDKTLENSKVMNLSSLNSRSSEKKVPLNLPFLNNIDLSHSTLINETKFQKISRNYGIPNEIPLKSSNSENFNFEIIEFLGFGSRGKAFHAIDANNNREVALKFLEFKTFSDKSYLNSVRELIVLQILTKTPDSNRYFLNLFDFYLDDSEGDQGKLYLVIVLEFSLMDLRELLSLRQEINEKFEDSELLFILSSLIQGLSQLKSLSLAHRDFKLENLFLTKEFNVKIGDFSEAKVFEKSLDDFSFKCSIKGSHIFMSPELLFAYEGNTRSLIYDPWISDLYSIALAIYQLKSFDNSLERDKVLLTLNNNRSLDRILMKMLEKDPNQRISIEKLLETLKYEEISIKLGQKAFIQKTEELIKLRKSRILEKNDDFIEILKKSLIVSEVYTRVFQYSKAIEKSLEILQYIGSFLSINKENDYEIRIELLQARVYENLGEIYKRNLQYEPSLFNYQEAIRLLVKLLEKKPENNEFHEHLLRNSLNLASLLRFSGRTAESLNLLEEIKEELSQKLLRTLNQFGDISLEEYKEKLNKIYLNFAEVYEVFAGLLRARKDSISAKKSLEKALNYLKFSNKNEILLMNYQTIYAENLLEIGDFEKSRDLLEKILENSRKTGFFNENSGLCLILLSRICSRNEDFQLAEACIDQALQVYKRLFKDNEKNKRFSEIYREKAKIMRKIEKYEISEEFIRKALDISRQIEDFSENMRIKWKLARVLKEKGDFKGEVKEIEEIYAEIQRNRENFFKNTQFEGKVMRRLGEIYKENKELDKSIIVYQEALGSLKKNLMREETLIGLCENLIEINGIDLEGKIRKMKEYEKEAGELNRSSKNKRNKEKLKMLKKFIEKKKI